MEPQSLCLYDDEGVKLAPAGPSVTETACVSKPTSGPEGSNNLWSFLSPVFKKPDRKKKSEEVLRRRHRVEKGTGISSEGAMVKLDLRTRLVKVNPQRSEKMRWKTRERCLVARRERSASARERSLTLLSATSAKTESETAQDLSSIPEHARWNCVSRSR